MGAIGEELMACDGPVDFCVWSVTASLCTPWSVTSFGCCGGVNSPVLSADMVSPLILRGPEQEGTMGDTELGGDGLPGWL